MCINSIIYQLYFYVDYSIMLENRRGIKMELTKCESQVMMIIWSTDYDMALPEIMDLVNHRYQKSWKPQTVSTFLTRCV